jgi:hypothetical protein
LLSLYHRIALAFSLALWESMFLVALCLWHFFKVQLKIIFNGVLMKVRRNIASLVSLFF